MSKLPDVLSYGQRPSLRSNRVDVPDESGVIIAESLQNAAGNFAKLAAEKKQKDDRLSYSLAKNEILRADIAARQGLEDREDFEHFDSSYTDAFQESSGEILGRYTLSPSDRALLAAESDLIRERGRVYAGELSRQKRIDFQRGAIESNLNSALEEIALAPPQLANDLMLTQLENITSAIEAGIYGDQEGQRMLQAFVADAAVGSLDGMEVEARLKELKLSEAHRKARGPITPEDIDKGEGSGSIADFLHQDVVRRMIEEAETELELEKEYDIAYRVSDEVFNNNRENQKAGMDEMRRILKEMGVPAKTRARTEDVLRGRYNEKIDVERRLSTDIVRAYSDEMRNSTPDKPFTYNDIPASELRLLSPGQDKLLRDYSTMVANGQYFGDKDRYVKEAGDVDDQGNLVRGSLEVWNNMSAREQAETNLFDAAWRVAFTEAGWNALETRQRSAQNAMAGGGAGDNVQTNDQILQSVLIGARIIPQTGRSDEENEIYQRIRSRFNDQVAELQEKEYGGKKAPYQARKNELLRILAEQAWTRDSGWGGWFGFDGTEPMSLWSMTEDEMESGYIPIDRWRNEPFTEEIDGKPVTQTTEEYLRNRAKKQGLEPDQKDLENAFFALVAGMSAAEVDDRLAGKGDK
jgi:hypothetical protein